MASSSWNADNANLGYEIKWGEHFNPPHPWDMRWDDVMIGIDVALNRDPRNIGQQIGTSNMYVKALFNEPPLPFADLYYSVQE